VRWLRTAVQLLTASATPARKRPHICLRTLLPRCGGWTVVHTKLPVACLLQPKHGQPLVEPRLATLAESFPGQKQHLHSTEIPYSACYHRICMGHLDILARFQSSPDAIEPPASLRASVSRCWCLAEALAVVDASRVCLNGQCGLLPAAEGCSQPSGRPICLLDL
jgi:hypothetical protein